MTVSSRTRSGAMLTTICCNNHQRRFWFRRSQNDLLDATISQIGVEVACRRSRQANSGISVMERIWGLTYAAPPEENDYSSGDLTGSAMACVSIANVYVRFRTRFAVARGPCRTNSLPRCLHILRTFFTGRWRQARRRPRICLLIAGLAEIVSISSLFPALLQISGESTELPPAFQGRSGHSAVPHWGQALRFYP